MTLLFATHNQNKVKEIASLLPLGYELRSLCDLNFHEEIPETSDTIDGNSLLKAQYLFEKLRKPCIAEDTGLEIESLQGRPGVRSARYAGEPTNANANINKVLGEMKGQQNRAAKFKTVITHYFAQGYVQYVGICEGEILETPRGTDGFGYDPIFLPKGCNHSFAQMRLEEKNVFSHRKKAFEKFLADLKK